MVFSNNFVVAIKCNGKILREFKDVEQFVKLPFGSEYSILIKNLNSRKAVVSISIDGEDVLDGSRLVIEGNNEVELKGFKKGNKVTNKFKFIEKTEAISDYRGDRVDDSIIRVEYTFEKFVQKRYDQIVAKRTVYYDYSPFDWYYFPYRTDGTQYTLTSGIVCKNSDGRATDMVNCFHNQTICDSTQEHPELTNCGITVKGSDDVDQNFVAGYTKELEDVSNVITIKLVGHKATCGVIQTPITVRTKLTCVTCGTKNKSKNKFCFNCGTFL